MPFYEEAKKAANEMSVAQHVPGKYIACEMTMSRKDWNSMYDGITSIVRSGQDVLATVWHPYETKESEMAQAQLFAAAPELLQWLEVAEDMLKQAMKQTEFTLGACKNMVAIRAVISKAKGEA